MKVGVVGLGSIGLRHAQNLRDLGHEVIGYDPDEKKMWSFQGRTFDRLACFCGTDAVVIASPSDQHANDLRTACIYGVPPLIEKPLAMEVTDELLALIAELKNDERPAMVGYNLRFHGSAIQAKTWLDRAEIGHPLWAHFCCGQRNDKYGDLIHNWSHEIDLALWLLGPAKVVATSANREIADILLVHDYGCRTHIHLDYVTPFTKRSFDIVGTNGGIFVGLTMREARLFKGPGPDEVDARISDDSYDENYIDEMKAFLRRAEGKPAYGASISDGLAALEICDAARAMAGLK